MDKMIRYFPHKGNYVGDREYLEYNDANLLQLTRKLINELTADVEIELTIWEYDEGNYLHAEISEQMFPANHRDFEFCYLGHSNYDYDNGKEFQTEGYRIKTLLKKEFSDIPVKSRFNWRGII